MNIFKKLVSLLTNHKSETHETNSDLTSLTVSSYLKDFLENEVLVGLDITKEHFWSSFEKIVNEFSPRNKALLQKEKIFNHRLIIGILTTKMKILILKNIKHS